METGSGKGSLDNVQLENNFWFIEVFNSKTAQKGFVIMPEKKSEKLLIAYDFVADVTKFDSQEEAQRCLDSLPVLKTLDGYAKVKSGNDLIREGAASALGDEELFVVVNQAGWKIFYSDKRKDYYFDNKPTGAQIFYWKDLNVLMAHLERKYPKMTLVAQKLGKTQSFKV